MSLRLECLAVSSVSSIAMINHCAKVNKSKNRTEAPHQRLLSQHDLHARRHLQLQFQVSPSTPVFNQPLFIKKQPRQYTVITMAQAGSNSPVQNAQANAIEMQQPGAKQTMRKLLPHPSSASPLRTDYEYRTHDAKPRSNFRTTRCAGTKGGTSYAFERW